jgi:tetratricopeptide (TPR) repeat protein
LGNFLSAINLYTESLEIEPNHIKTLSNRAAAYLKLKDEESCIKDCDVAIKLVEQEEWILENEFKQDDGNIMNRRKQKAKLFARRGYAFTLLGELQKGLDDYLLAVKNDEDNKSLLIDIESIRVQISEINKST